MNETENLTNSEGINSNNFNFKDQRIQGAENTGKNNENPH
jgi:hypothetical protein